MNYVFPTPSVFAPTVPSLVSTPSRADSTRTFAFAIASAMHLNGKGLFQFSNRFGFIVGLSRW
ncbi:hypothetical protein BC834DRAFT_875011 [Gloeopeniophorella convolvens]|nr:hypothetical protein BC834DRAFT_875011 [Gloeopeniophorella convolvens]